MSKADVKHLMQGASEATNEKAERERQKSPPPDPKPNGASNQYPGIMSASDFIAGFKPQRPLLRPWDLKPGWLYSFTAPTSYAKTAISLTEAVSLA
jgi:hypothetical protein